MPACLRRNQKCLDAGQQNLYITDFSFTTTTTQERENQMSIESNLESIAKSLELIAKAVLEGLPVAERKAAAPAPTAAPVAERKAAGKAAAPAPAPFAAPTPAPTPAPAPFVAPAPAAAVVPFPAAAAPTPAEQNATVPFTNNAGLKAFMVKMFNEKGPQFGQVLGQILAKYGVNDPAEVSPSNFAAIYADIVEAAK